MTKGAVPDRAEVAAIIEEGIAHHRAGRLTDAEAAYQRVISAHPDEPDALHLLGVIAYQTRDYDIAADLVGKAIAVRPGAAIFHNDLGLTLKALGNLEGAQAAYGKALALNPDYAEAHNNLGIVLKVQGKPDEAIAAHHRALALKPGYVSAHSNLGTALREQGRLEEAEAAYRRVIDLKPDDAGAHNNLGVSLRDQGKAQEAIAAYRAALSLKPDYAEAFSNLGNALKDQGQLDAAVTAYQRALALKPDHANAHNNLGTALKAQGRPDAAMAAYRRALALKPDHAGAHTNLGNMLRDQGKPADAVAAHNMALALKPDYAEAHNNLGNALTDQGKFEASEAAYRRALECKPDYVEAYNNLAALLRDQGKMNEAMAACREALDVAPDYAEAHVNLGLILMKLARFDEGLREYEWRWRMKGASPREFLQPQWDGQECPGKTVLIHAEQGFGDTLQFIRYARLIRARGGRVVFECPKSLVELLRGTDGVDHLVPAGEPLPQFAFHVPLLSLPGILATTLSDIPADVPYVSVPDGAVMLPLDPAEGRRRVGIVWAGNPRHTNDRNRSCPLHHFEALARRDDVTLYSLQVGPGAADLEDRATDAPIHDLATRLDDFADTAAVVSQLDLVITVDTAVAHLAGAMAWPVWTLLPFAPDWRWMLDRDDSPWYPTMRLFRQSRPRDWYDVFDRIGRALTAETEGA